jgi:hypothetical protein
MAFPRSLAWLVAVAAYPGAAAAHPAWGAAGSLVRLSLAVCGETAPLYPARDGSGRYYLEARRGCAYTVSLENRTGDRLGVVLTVDGLNVISGQRDAGRGRMYVLEPWGETSVSGWRASLDEVQRFTFVDERASYAARSGKANSRMGWIEAAVYRERRPWVHWPWQGRVTPERRERADDSAGGERSGRSAPPAAEAPKSKRDADAAGATPYEEAERLRSLGYADGYEPAAPPTSYPGTGWGPRAADRVEVVDFDPEARPAERVTLRYEYAGALQALGILPRPWPSRDRLMERERGFARPPR